MDIFENKVELQKFKSTNKLWNDLGLNKAWSVGIVSKLIKSKSFKNKEEWYDFYFQSGKDRLDLICKLPEKEQKALLSGDKVNYKGENAILNYNYGRTKEELCSKGIIMYNEILKLGNPFNLDMVDCQFTSFFRTVCETWNGIIIRECNTKHTIENYFHSKDKHISLIDVSGKFDCIYAIDFELYYEGKIICGIQIKPNSYNHSNVSYLEDALIINTNKNKKYKSLYNRDVYYIYSSKEGKITNTEILVEIDKLL